MTVVVQKKPFHPVLFLACMLLVVALFSIDLYNPSLPSISAALNVSHQLSRALIVTFLVGYTFSQLLFGITADVFGRRKVIVSSLLLVTVANALSASATHGWQLLVYRGLTGLGAGGCPVVSRAMIRDHYESNQALIHAFAIYTMAGTLSPALAPVAGGIIEDIFPWNMNFVVLALLSFLALVVVLCLMKETHQKNDSIMLKHVFVIYKELLSHGSFVACGILAGLGYSISLSYYTINPFIFQWQYHLRPGVNGFCYLLYSLCLFLGSYISKKTSHRFPPFKLMRYVIACFLLASVLMLIAAWIPSISIVLIFSSLMAVLVGFGSPLFISAPLMDFSHIAGIASATQGALKMLTSAVVLLLILVFHASSVTNLSLVFVLIAVLMGMVSMTFRSHSKA